jgi:uncharacterized protein YkwD
VRTGLRAVTLVGAVAVAGCAPEPPPARVSALTSPSVSEPPGGRADGGRVAAEEPVRAEPSGSPSASANASPTASRAAGFRPAGPAASHYGGAPPRYRKTAADALRAKVFKQVRGVCRKLHLPPPVPDPRLDWVMTDLAREVRGDDLPALEALDFLLGYYGLAEPSPRVLLSRTRAGGQAQMLKRIQSGIETMLRERTMKRIGVGIDRAEDTIYLAVGFQERHDELRGLVARQLPAGGSEPIVVRLDPGYANPGLVITGPDGRVAEERPPLRDATASGEIRCRGEGKHQVELTAVGPSGPAVLANFPVYCGVAPPAESPGPAGARPTAAVPVEVEQAIVALVGRDRQRAGVGPLVLDERLAEIARAHSRDMATHDFVAHVSPRTGSAMDRVHAAGLAPGLVMENVGRAYSAEEAEAGFLASPGHRGNVLDSRARRVGVGVAFGAPVTGTRPVYVTQLFSN